jgi:hypothetical protein
MHLLPQVCSGPSTEIACWQKGNAANPTACISPSGMTLMHSCKRSASSLLREPP